MLTNVFVDLTGVTFSGFMPGAASAKYTLDFYANTACDPSGFGEGETYIGTTNITMGGTCTNGFSVKFFKIVPCRFFATATATDTNNNTSEFSACMPATALDTDGDGLCDLDEILAGTDRTNSASSFRITSITTEGSNIRVSWMVGAGRTNLLQAASGSAGGSCSNNFGDLGPQIIVAGIGTSVITNRLDVGGATNKASRFYRVRLVP